MLSKNEFIAKHKVKFAGLTKPAIDLRYDSYRRSYAANAPPTAASVPRRAPALNAVARRSGPGPSMRADAAQAAIARAYAEHDLMRAMLDPFAIEGVPRIPDANYAHSSTTKFKFNVDIQSNDIGGVAFFMRASPWQTFAVSDTQSNVATAAGAASHYVSGMEWNAYAQAVSRQTSMEIDTPQWANNAWSIPIITEVLKRNGANRDFALRDCSQASAFYGVAAAWRPVCAGFKFTYTGAVLQASGEMAVARWPGTYRAPTIANYALRMNLDAQSVPLTQVEFGPTFDTVQALPGAQVYAAASGCTAIWAPASRQCQTEWRQVKPVPAMCPSLDGDLGMFQVSNAFASGELILPPPVVGDNARALALHDRLYSQNANTIEWSQLGTGGTIGAGRLLYFQDGNATHTAAEIDQLTSDRCLDLIQSQYATDMMESDSGLILVGEGFPANATVGTIEVVVGVEYLPDTRTVSFGSDARGTAVGTPAKQMASHAIAVHAAKAAPSSLPGAKSGGDFIAKIADMAESIGNAIPRVGAAVAQAAPYVESLLAALAI